MAAHIFPAVIKGKGKCTSKIMAFLGRKKWDCWIDFLAHVHQMQFSSCVLWNEVKCIVEQTLNALRFPVIFPFESRMKEKGRLQRALTCWFFSTRQRALHITVRSLSLSTERVWKITKILSVGWVLSFVRHSRVGWNCHFWKWQSLLCLKSEN